MTTRSSPQASHQAKRAREVELMEHAKALHEVRTFRCARAVAALAVFDRTALQEWAGKLASTEAELHESQAALVRSETKKVGRSPFRSGLM